MKFLKEICEPVGIFLSLCVLLLMYTLEKCKILQMDLNVNNVGGKVHCHHSVKNKYSIDILMLINNI